MLVVTYNSRKWLPGLLDSLVQTSYAKEKLRLVVVDNASTDDTAAYLRSRAAELPFGLEIIESGVNGGFTGGYRLAMEHAEAPYWFVLNPDTRVAPDAIVRLVETLEADPDAGIAEATIAAQHPKYFDPFTGETSWSSGACMMLRAAAVADTGGGFNQAFFMYARRRPLLAHVAAWLEMSVCSRRGGRAFYRRPRSAEDAAHAALFQHAQRGLDAGHVRQSGGNLPLLPGDAPRRSGRDLRFGTAAEHSRRCWPRWRSCRGHCGTGLHSGGWDAIAGCNSMVGNMAAICRISPWRPAPRRPRRRCRRPALCSSPSGAFQRRPSPPPTDAAESVSISFPRFGRRANQTGIVMCRQAEIRFRPPCPPGACCAASSPCLPASPPAVAGSASHRTIAESSRQEIDRAAGTAHGEWVPLAAALAASGERENHAWFPQPGQGRVRLLGRSGNPCPKPACGVRHRTGPFFGRTARPRTFGVCRKHGPVPLPAAPAGKPGHQRDYSHAQSREEGVPRVIRRLFRGSAEAFEIILVDSRSTDRTPEMMAQWSHSPRMSAGLRCRAPGGRRRPQPGARSRPGRLLVLMDDNILVGRDFLSQLWRSHCKSREEVLLVKIIAPWEGMVDPFFRFLLQSQEVNIYNFPDPNNVPAGYFYTGCVAVPRAVLGKRVSTKVLPSMAWKTSSSASACCAAGRA